jgi:hypothetical protein
MAVPELRGVDAVPGTLDQLVVGEAPRQVGVARIPEALLGPIAPRSRRRGGRADSS